jgi:hypothetical protein
MDSVDFGFSKKSFFNSLLCHEGARGTVPAPGRSIDGNELLTTKQLQKVLAAGISWA